MRDRTEERIRRYERVAEELEGSASARARAVADKMRRGLKAEFDTEIIRIRARARALLKTDPEDAEMLKVVLEAADMAISGKRKDSHLKRRTKVKSDAAAEFERQKEALNEALARNEKCLREGINTDDEYRVVTQLKSDIDSFIKSIKKNDELSKKAKTDMEAHYRQHIPAANAVRKAYLDRTGRKHTEVMGGKSND